MQEILITVIGFLVFLLIGHWRRRSFVDSPDNQSILAEEALVHAKSEHGSRFDQFYIIHFYIAARDTVVDCDVPFEIWRDLEMKTRGTLTHQGGIFYSFEMKDAIYCEDSLREPESQY